MLVSGYNNIILLPNCTMLYYVFSGPLSLRAYVPEIKFNNNNPIINKITWNHVRYLVGFVPESSEEELARIDILGADWYIYEEGERKVATRQSRAQIMQPDVWTMSTGVDQARAVGLCRLSRNV